MTGRGLVALLVIAGTACINDTRSTGPAIGKPSAAISHALTTGSKFFFLLPPIVDDPTASFQLPFNPFLLSALKVEVCRLNDAATDCEEVLAEFTATSGFGSEVIRVEADDEHYIVNWHTNDHDPSLSSDEIYRISVFLHSEQMGFAEVKFVSGGKEAKNTLTQGYFPLQENSRRTLPLKFRLEGLGTRCAAVTVDCAEAIVLPQQETIVSTAEKDAVWAFSGDEFSEPLVATITRLPDKDENGSLFPPGQGWLDTDDFQYLPQFEFSVATLDGNEVEQLENESRVGVCTPDAAADETSGDYHPPDETKVVLAKGGEPGTFARLRRVDISDLVAQGHIECPGTVILSDGPRSDLSLYAQLRWLLEHAGRVLGPRVAHANAVAVTDAMGGSMSDLKGTPVGPVEAPDLLIQDIGSTINSSGTGTVQATVANVGQGTADPAFEWRLKLERVNVSPSVIIFEQTQPVTAIPPNSSVGLEVNVALSPGDYLLTATADVADVVVEFDEGNNIAMHTFTLDALALAGYEVMTSDVVTLASGGGFHRQSVQCSAGKVILGGGAQVVAEGTADFSTRIQESAPGKVGSGETERDVWLVSIKNQDESSHDIRIFATCAETSPEG